MRYLLALLLSCALLPAGAFARDSLGTFDMWGAFRDPDVPQCYAISQPVAFRGKRHYRAYADIAFWPKRGIRGQVHVRLSRDVAPGSAIILRLGVRRFRLTGGARDAWASDRRMDAAIAAALRSVQTMDVTATDRRGRTIRDRYSLRGVATAMDAAALGCARLGR